MWPWQQFNWGMFWALIAAFVVVDIFKSLIGFIIGRLSE
jgi:hypothetical protein